MKVIALTFSGGHVGIMRIVREAANVEEQIQKFEAVNPQTVISWREISEEELPIECKKGNREFRNALVDRAGKLEIDMPKARNLHREHLRTLRAPLLAALDINFQRADELGDAAEKSRIARLKQALRDVTEAPRIEAAQTPEALKSVLPEILNASRQ